MSKRCKFKLGKFNCGSYAFNLDEEDINQGDYCDRHYWQDQAQKARADEREACAEVCKKQADVYAGLEPNPTTQAAWAACIDNRDAIRARGQPTCAHEWIDNTQIKPQWHCAKCGVEYKKEQA
jgi:hypothetical protein